MQVMERPVEETFEGTPVIDVIKEVKEAIRAYQKESDQQDQGIGLKTVELTLNVVTTKDVEGKPKFKIPILEWEIGGGYKYTKEQTQEIVLSLEPSDDIDLFESREIQTQVLDGLRTIGDIAKNAALEEPRLTLSDGSIEMKFVVTREGTVQAAVVGADYSRATTHSLKVTIGAPEKATES